ncbi:MAG: class II fumarate hydratase [Candidatus Pelagibacter bacterium]|jgi:fumarate hydratase class II|nr:fumarate hydratase, class II [Candidatus Pelagibacter sp.]MDP7541330.1 class II fumarate hydratase [Candidatus Pelagibacter bacterium]|tara:strand:- start:408 stop:1796 length:1389 start_codon:yes stop_codon:yes gene_type:complete
MKKRKEYDSIGVINVPGDKYWGASTQRSKKYFDIGKFLVRHELIKSIAIIKKSAAIVHRNDKQIEPRIANAIVKAANEVIQEKLNDHFPLKVWQTGSGTQTNMNVNEVIANRAIEILGGKKGTKKPVHPNDHVNKSQSTNDVFPTAMHIAIAIEAKDKLLPSLTLLNKELKKKVSKFKNIVKVGRTHLQDATPLSLGQEFSGYQSQLETSIKRIKNALNEIYFLAQGGTAVGTGINTKKNFDKKIVKEIKKITKIPFKPAKNKFAALASHDAVVNFSGTLNTTSVCLMKIANDIRFLGSGPRAGYGELILPSNEPGSSIMPGKINPTQSEAVTMVCVKVIGNHNGITIAGSQGHFELNVFKPLIAHNILQSIDLLADSSKNFALYCVKGIIADKKKIKEYLDNSLMLVTALTPHIGYDNVARIARNALKNNTSLKYEALKTGLIKEKDYNKIVDPRKMIGPS